MNYGQAVVAQELARLGIVSIEQAGTPWAVALCPLHDDSNPSFTVNLDEGGWKCRAGCGSHGDLAVLVARLTGESEDVARARLRAGLAGDVESLALALEPRSGPGEARSEGSGGDVDLVYDHGRVPKYMLRRGFTVDVLREWDVGKKVDRFGTLRVVIPVHQDGELRGLAMRAVGQAEPRYLYSDGFDVSRTLLGLDHLPLGTREVVVVEGPLDALWCYQHGIPAVALLGSSLSHAQADLLRRRFWGVTLMLDGDRAGREGTARAWRMLFGSVWLWDAELPAGRDPQDCAGEELRATLVSAAGLYTLARR